MAFDFSLSDMKTRFTPDAAASCWCEIEVMSEMNEVPWAQIYTAIIEAIADGVLPAKLAYRIVTRRPNGGSLYDMEEPDYPHSSVKREDLKAWALSRGQKPKFLFPEMRVLNEPPAILTPTEKVTPLRQSQLDKARCQAIAQVLWEENPTRTIADMIRDKRILKFGNGNQYADETLHGWLKDVDPRPPEAKVGRPVKELEKTE